MWKEYSILIWDFMYTRALVFAVMIYVFLRGEPLKIPDSVIRLIEGELYNSDNILYYYSQLDSVTIPILEQLLIKNNS